MDEGGWTARAAVKQVASLGGIGLLTGALAGWVALSGAADTAVRAARAASVFWALFLLLPATLLLWFWLSWRQQRGTRQASLSRAVAVSLAAGLAGGLLAALAFVATSTQILVMFGGTAAGQFQQSFYAKVGWPAIWSLLAVVVVMALALASATYLRRRRTG